MIRISLANLNLLKSIIIDFKTLMYLISKLLPLFLLPLGIALILSILKVLFKVKKADILSITILYIFSLGIVSEKFWEWIEYPWQRLKVEQIENGDAIVVLSGGGKVLAPGKANIYEWNDPDRFLAGIDLFKQKKAPKLIFTGGSSPLRKKMPLEGELYKQEAIKYGIPSKAISSTSLVFNTAQEAIEVNNLLKLNQNELPKKIILVTSAFHMKRAKKAFERQGLIVYPFPVDFKSTNSSKGFELMNPYNWIPNSASLHRTSKALREVLGRIIYNIKYFF